MDFTPLHLGAQALLSPFCRQEGRWTSDTNFSNMFLWRHSREISYCLDSVNQVLVIQTRYPNQMPFIFYPLTPMPYEIQNLHSPHIKAAIEATRAFYAAQGLPLEIHSVRNEELEVLKQWYGEGLEIQERRDRFEYVYSVESLISLSGRKFHKKKNHLNKFYLQYPSTTYESLSEHNLTEVAHVANAWFKADTREDSGLKFENLGINDALTHFKSLALKGGLLRCEGEIIAFSFGEELDSKLALIHIEKANIAFSGAYQAINQALLEHEFSHLHYANREEDLGLEGLRKAKLSYQPEFLLEKYDVRFKD